MSKEITVYSYHRCPFAIRVRIALFEKGVPFKIIEEDLKNFSEKLRAMHPEAKVPVLVHGSKVLYESAIITEYVEDTFPGKVSLMPKDPGERADVRLWTYWCNQIFKPDLDRFKYGVSRFPAEELPGIEEKVINHLKKLEDKLSRQDWLVGKNFSLADIHCFPFCRQLSRVTPPPTFLPQFKALARWMECLSQRASVQKTLSKAVSF